MLGKIGLFDRDSELRDLEKYYRGCLSFGANYGVIVYGWRCIGKTMILKEFARRVRCIYINCIWISDPYLFLRLVLNFLPENVSNMFRLYVKEEDPMLVLRKAFEALMALSETRNGIAIVLDEFHVFVEKVSGRIVREKKIKKEVVINDILGLLKDVVEMKKAFWIFSTSLGWEKIREKITRPKKLRVHSLLF